MSRPATHPPLAHRHWCGARLKVNQHWVLLAAARYDLRAHQVSQTQVGIGYIDDCLILALNYITDYAYWQRVRKSYLHDAGQLAHAWRKYARSRGIVTRGAGTHRHAVTACNRQLASTRKRTERTCSTIS